MSSKDLQEAQSTLTTNKKLDDTISQILALTNALNIQVEELQRSRPTRPLPHQKLLTEK